MHDTILLVRLVTSAATRFMAAIPGRTCIGSRFGSTPESKTLEFFMGRDILCPATSATGAAILIEHFYAGSCRHPSFAAGTVYASRQTGSSRPSVGERT